MEMLLASAIGAVICYIYVNSNDEIDAEEHKSKTIKLKKTHATVTTTEKASVEPAIIGPKTSIPIKPKSVVKKPDYSMQLINNMLDDMLANESH